MSGSTDEGWMEEKETAEDAESAEEEEEKAK
jgi:hypothetical protein